LKRVKAQAQRIAIMDTELKLMAADQAVPCVLDRLAARCFTLTSVAGVCLVLLRHDDPQRSVCVLDVALAGASSWWLDGFISVVSPERRGPLALERRRHRVDQVEELKRIAASAMASATTSITAHAALEDLN
jgi:hypothetical protein